MPLMHCQFYAQTLENTASVLLYLPLAKNAARRYMSLDEVYRPRQLKTLYLLHGLHGSETDWIRKTNAERYAEEAGVALVMPSVQHSFYCDMDCGLQYLQFLTEELPRFVRYALPLSSAREDTAIAGCSMGGYGAVKAALVKPELYGKAFSFSGALDIHAVLSHGTPDQQEALTHVFGTGATRRANDLFILAAERAKEKASLPQLFMSCGTEDTLCYQMNQDFKAHLETLQLPFAYEERPGTHSWDFWDEEIKKVLASL